jgi:D-cysteine desulfhydrase
MPPRLSLAALPTPLEHLDRLSAAWGGPSIWAKRDDRTGFGVSGNKIRKLEFHIAAARARGADVLVTCGAAQSNHCRATALAAARVGLDCVLYLRTPDGSPPDRPQGNHLLSVLAGAEVRFIDPEWYACRDEEMAAAAREMSDAGRSPWVIPEGASDGIGMWGYVQAAAEAHDQLAAAGVTQPFHWHASSSGGTTAGLAAHVSMAGLADRVVAVSVSDRYDDLRLRIERIWRDAFPELSDSLSADDLEIRDEYIGRGYGLATTEELAVQAEATSLTGMILDPAYTGKALYALRREIQRGRFSPDDDVVFWHTGGGFAALAFDYDEPTGR